MKYINNDAEHYQILFDLGLLDDDEDWKMYQEQERRFDEVLDSVSLEQYWSYCAIKNNN
jgi:hypothetical protein